MTTPPVVLFLSLALFVAFASSQALEAKDIQFGGELSFNSTTDQWGFRSIAVGTWGVALWNGAWWHSVQAEVDTKKPVINGDFIWGSVYVGTGHYPVSWLAFYGASVEADRNISDPGGVDWSSFNVSFTSGFIASAFLAIVERNATGAPVSILLLKNLLWTYNATASRSLTNSSIGVYAFVFDGKELIPSSLHVQITYIVTQSGGVLNLLDGILIVPRALESIVVIEGWNYRDPSNYLSLRVAVGSLETSWTGSGQLSAGSGDGGVYFHFAKTATVDRIGGKPAKIGYTATVDVDTAFENPSISAQLKGRYKQSAVAQIVEVDFPAGAQSIIYDPTMGSGESPFPNNPSVNDQGLVVGLSVGGAILAVIIVVVVVVMFRKRGNYQTVH